MLVPAADLPVTSPPDVPLWVENFFWCAFDQEQGVGVTLHLASLPHDFGLIRQTLIVYLPDGSLRCNISVGGARGESFVAGPTVRATCLEPYSRWQLHYDGVVVASDPDRLWSGPLCDGRKSPLRIELDCECVTPLWDAAAGGGHEGLERTKWANYHHQQSVRLTGSVHVDGTVYDVDCRGVRDHSRGVRNLASWGGHCLLSAAFPSGRALGALVVFGPDGRAGMNTAYGVFDGEIVRGSVSVPPPGLTRAAMDRQTFAIALDLGGDIHAVNVETPQRGRLRALVTMLAPNDVVIGFDEQDHAPIGLAWMPATFDWDGEQASGVIERSATISAVRAG